MQQREVIGMYREHSKTKATHRYDSKNSKSRKIKIESIDKEIDTWRGASKAIERGCQSSVIRRIVKYKANAGGITD